MGGRTGPLYSCIHSGKQTPRHPRRLEGHFDARNQFMMAPAFFRAVALQKQFALCNLIAVLTSGLESQVSARGKPVKKRRPVENP